MALGEYDIQESIYRNALKEKPSFDFLNMPYTREFPPRNYPGISEAEQKLHTLFPEGLPRKTNNDNLDIGETARKGLGNNINNNQLLQNRISKNIEEPIPETTQTVSPSTPQDYHIDLIRGANRQDVVFNPTEGKYKPEEGWRPYDPFGTVTRDLNPEENKYWQQIRSGVMEKESDLQNRLNIAKIAGQSRENVAETMNERRKNPYDEVLSYLSENTGNKPMSTVNNNVSDFDEFENTLNAIREEPSNKGLDEKVMRQAAFNVLRNAKKRKAEILK